MNDNSTDEQEEKTPTAWCPRTAVQVDPGSAILGWARAVVPPRSASSSPGDLGELHRSASQALRVPPLTTLVRVCRPSPFTTSIALPPSANCLSGPLAFSFLRLMAFWLKTHKQFVRSSFRLGLSLSNAPATSRSVWWGSVDVVAQESEKSEFCRKDQGIIGV